jgi:hypothetical protein
MTQKSHFTQPTIYKHFYFKTEIKTKVDSYMPCKAMTPPSMITGSNCENDGDFDKFSSNMLLNCRGKKLILVVYTRV